MLDWAKPKSDWFVLKYGKLQSYSQRLSQQTVSSILRLREITHLIDIELALSSSQFSIAGCKLPNEIMAVGGKEILWEI